MSSNIAKYLDIFEPKAYVYLFLFLILLFSGTRLPRKFVQAISPIQNLGLELLSPASTKDSKPSEETDGNEFDIIAVHGLAANPEYTWRAKDHHWLRDFLPQDFPGARIFVFKYDSRYMAFAPAKTPFECGMQLLNEMKRNFDNDPVIKTSKRRPIIFIGHSFGGIVIKQALVTAAADEEFKKIKDATFGVIFLGTPHAGSSASALGSFMCKIMAMFGSSSEIINILSYRSLALLDLSSSYQKIFKDYSFSFSFYEKVPTRLAGFFAVQVVDSTSATSAPGDRDSMDRDHSKMNKYGSRDDNDYKKIVAQIKYMYAQSSGKMSKNGFDIPLQIPFNRDNKFAGREVELSRLRRKLESQKSKDQNATAIYALAGTGGMGKTSLAVEYVYQYRETYTAVFWVNASSKEDADSGFYNITQTIIREMAKSATNPNYTEISNKLGLISVLDAGETLSTNIQYTEKIKNAVLNWLTNPENKTWLMVMDNYDDIESYDIKEYIPFCNGSIIITSRRKMELSHIANETEDLEGLGKDASIELLFALSGILRTAEAEKDAHAVAEQLGCMPLALEHAGSFMRNMHIPMSEYIEYFEQLFETVHQELPLSTKSNRQKTVLKTWEVSFDAIKKKNPKAAELLQLCSFLDPTDIWEGIFFSNPSDLKEKIAVKVGLKELVSYSLASYTETGGIRIHRVVHAWARERMGKKQRRETMEQLTGYLVALSEHPKISREEKAYNYVFELMYFRHLNAYGQYLEKEGYLNPEIEENSASDNLLSIFSSITFSLYLQGNVQTSLKWCKRSLYLHEKNLGPNDAKTLKTVKLLSVIYREESDYENAAKQALRAYYGLQELYGPGTLAAIDIIYNFTIIYQQSDQFDTALGWCLEGLKDCRDLPEGHKMRIALTAQKARILQCMGNYEEALLCNQQAFEDCSKYLKEEVELSIVTVKQMALILEEMGNYSEAKDWCEKALNLYEKVMGEEHPNTLSAMTLMGNILQEKGDLDEAVLYIKRALECKTRTLGPYHIYTLASVRSLGDLYNRMGKYKDAIECYDRQLSVTDKLYPEDNMTTVLIAVANKADALCGIREYAEALQLFNRLLRAYKKNLRSDHPWILRIEKRIENLEKLVKEISDGTITFDSTNGKYQNTIEQLDEVNEEMVKKLTRSHSL